MSLKDILYIYKYTVYQCLPCRTGMKWQQTHACPKCLFHANCLIICAKRNVPEALSVDKGTLVTPNMIHVFHSVSRLRSLTSPRMSPHRGTNDSPAPPPPPLPHSQVMIFPNNLVERSVVYLFFFSYFNILRRASSRSSDWFGCLFLWDKLFCF